MSNHWEKKLYENFEIKASLKSLDGEFDLNFLHTLMMVNM
jgi:hypothetical protein